jgi:hypothetical protein
VHRPQLNNPHGLALVPYTASPFIFIHWPIFCRISTLFSGNSPRFVGPTFSRKLPPLEAISRRFLMSVSGVL